MSHSHLPLAMSDTYLQGFAYIEFLETDAVETALLLDNSELRGRNIKVCGSTCLRCVPEGGMCWQGCTVAALVICYLLLLILCLLCCLHCCVLHAYCSIFPASGMSGACLHTLELLYHSQSIRRYCLPPPCGPVPSCSVFCLLYGLHCCLSFVTAPLPGHSQAHQCAWNEVSGPWAGAWKRLSGSWRVRIWIWLRVGYLMSTTAACMPVRVYRVSGCYAVQINVSQNV